jgi:serine protease AprX
MRIICLALSFIIVVTSTLEAQSIHPKIEKALHSDVLAGRNADVLLIFSEKADLGNARLLRGKAAKAQFVFNALQDCANRSHANALQILRKHDAAANSLFLVNSIAVRQASPTLLEALAQLPELKCIAADPWVKLESPIMTSPDVVVERAAPEWGIQRINAPELWALGYKGQGISIGGADTGYDWAHPALSGQYRGKGTGIGAEHNYNWYDAIKGKSPLNTDSLNPCGFDSKVPCDDGIHGTHTMGTMVGDDGQGNQIGVAPAARWIGCRNMERGWGQPSTYIGCFQWFLAPTDLAGQNPDVALAPHVINNSWYCADIEGCNSLAVNELMRDAIIALKASGVFVVVSNGNFGPGCSTANVPPVYFEESFSIGATRMDDTIASFSSRGPIAIDGSFRIKPDVSAPGTNIRSCIPDSAYTNLGGTSMAGPHVAGLVALVLSAVPTAEGEVELIEQAIRESAVYRADTSNCGIPGTNVPNMAYGYGRVDAAAAALRLGALVSAPILSGLDDIKVSINPNPVQDDALFRIQNIKGESRIDIFNAAGVLVRSTAWLVTGGDLVRVPMADLASGIYFWQLSAGDLQRGGKFFK